MNEHPTKAGSAQEREKLAERREAVAAMERARLTDWTPQPANWSPTNFEGLLPESWCCIDCGINTAPGCLNRREMEAATRALGRSWETGEAGVNQTIDDKSEIFTVREAVWKKAGVEPMGGCLCIGCLEKRIGRRLKPKDFPRDDALNQVPVGTRRLLDRRK